MAVWITTDIKKRRNPGNYKQKHTAAARDDPNPTNTPPTQEFNTRDYFNPDAATGTQPPGTLQPPTRTPRSYTSLKHGLPSRRWLRLRASPPTKTSTASHPSDPEAKRDPDAPPVPPPLLESDRPDNLSAIAALPPPWDPDAEESDQEGRMGPIEGCPKHVWVPVAKDPQRRSSNVDGTPAAAWRRLCGAVCRRSSYSYCAPICSVAPATASWYHTSSSEREISRVEEAVNPDAATGTQSEVSTSQQC